MPASAPSMQGEPETSDSNDQAMQRRNRISKKRRVSQRLKDEQCTQCGRRGPVPIRDVRVQDDLHDMAPVPALT